MTEAALSVPRPTAPSSEALTARDLAELCQLWNLIESAALREARLDAWVRCARRPVALRRDERATPQVRRHVAFHLEIAHTGGNAQYELVLSEVLDELMPYLALAERLDPEALPRAEAALRRSLADASETAVQTLIGHVERLRTAVTSVL